MPPFFIKLVRCYPVLPPTNPVFSMSSGPRAAIIADDHPVVRDAMALVLRDSFPECRCLTADNLADVMSMLREDEGVDLAETELDRKRILGKREPLDRSDLDAVPSSADP